MALTDKDIVITPNKGAVAGTPPNITFTGADASTSATQTLKVFNVGTTSTISFEGPLGGSLLSISDNSIGKVAIGNTSTVNNYTLTVTGNAYASTGFYSAQLYDPTTPSQWYIYPAGGSRVNAISALGLEASTHDPYGLIAVTRGTGANYSYFGLTRQGQIGMGMGLDTSNNFWVGATNGGKDAIRTGTWFYSDTSGNLYGNASVRAPIFYDSDDTTYYVNPNSSSIISSLLVKSNTYNGAGTSGVTRSLLNANGDFQSYYAAESTPRITLGRDIGISGGAGLGFGGSTYALIGTNDTAGTNFYIKLSAATATLTTTPNVTVDGTGLTAITALRSPIYYDTDNTGYYVDPNNTSNINNLTVNGTFTLAGSITYSQLNLGAQRQYYIGNLAASATQAKRYEVARLFVDAVNWHNAGVTLVELHSQYFQGGDYQLWSVNYDYNGGTGVATCNLIAGDSPRGRYAQVTVSSPVQISGTYYYISVYVDVRYYASYYTYIKTDLSLNSSASAASSGSSWIFTSPTGTNLADFTPSNTVYTSNILQSGTDVRAPLFYDSDDTTYYLNPNSSSVLSSATFKGTVTVGPTTNGNYNENMRLVRSNTNSYVSIAMAADTSGSGSIAGQFTQLVYPTGTSGGAFAIRANSTDAFQISTGANIIIPNGSTYVQNYMYDNANTAYYLKPSSNSYLNYLQNAGNLQVNGGALAVPTSYKNVPGVTPGTSGTSWQRGASTIIQAGAAATDGTGWAYGSRFSSVDYGDGLATSVDVLYAGPSWTNDVMTWSGRSGRQGYVGIGQNTPSEALDMTGRLRIASSSNGYGWIYGIDTNHSIIMRGDRTGTAANYTNYYQYGGGLAAGLGHRFWTGGALAAQSERFRISDDGVYSLMAFRAPNYYDADDTTYYLDPNGTSNLSRLNTYEFFKRHNRYSSGEMYPVSYHSDGDMVWNIDPTWDNTELQTYFGSANVSWVADSTAPGGYAIQIVGGVNVASGTYGSGFPMIPIDSADDMFYMEVWVKGTSGSPYHYMGSIDYNENFSSLGGNPGSYGYWVMSGSTPGTSWVKYYGYISGFGGSTGQFKTGAKYWSPQALFNYGGGNSYISGWKVLRVNRQTSMVINTPNGGSVTGSSNSMGQTLTIKRSNTAQLNLGSYPGAWTSALQIQDNNASNWLWMSPLTGNTPTFATNYGAINFYMAGQNTGFAGSMNNGSFRSPIWYDSDNTAYYIDANNGGFNMVGGTSNRVGFYTGDSGYFVSNAEAAGAVVRLGSAWGQPGSYSNTSYTVGSENTIKFWTQGTQRGYIDSANILYMNSSVRTPIFYDLDDTTYYTNPNGNSFIYQLTTQSINGTSIFIGNQSVSTSNPLRINFHTDGDLNYYIGKPAGAWTQPLHIAFYTGIKLGANSSYGGTRIYQSSDMATELASFGNGDANTRINYNLYVPIVYDSNNTGYYLDPNNTSNLYSMTVAGGNSTISRDLYVYGNTGGSYGNRLVVGNNSTSYTLQDGNLRPTIQGWGAYPVLSLNHTVTSNTNHGPTLQFTSNGTGYQFVIGTTGNGSAISYGFANAGDWNPHNGINGYNGTTYMRAVAATGYVGIGGNQGPFGNGDPGYNLDVRGISYASASLRSPIWYDSDNTSYYIDGNNTSELHRLEVDDYIYARNGVGRIWLSGNLHIDSFSGNDIYLNYYGANRTRAFYGAQVESFRADTDGIVYAFNQFRTPIVYDYNNTGYYSDPNSSSQFSRIYANNYFVAQSQTGMMGDYADSGTADKVIWTIGTSWPLGNMYGLGYQYSTAGPYSLDHQIVIKENGTTYHRFGMNGYHYASGGITSASEMRSPIYYDQNNTGYYVNPDSTSNVYAMVAYSYQGNGNVGGTGSAIWAPSGIYSGSTEWLYGDMYRNGAATYNGGVSYQTIMYDNNDSGYYVDPNSTSRMYQINFNNLYYAGDTSYGFIGANVYTDTVNSGYAGDQLELCYYRGTYTTTAGSMRAPIFYDRDDTGYYVDPNGTSRTYATIGALQRYGSSGNVNTDFQNTPAGTMRHGGDDYGLSNAPGTGGWHFYDHYRHSNGSNYWGTQVAWGWEDNANNMYQRNISANSFSGWVRYLNSGNYNGYSYFTGAVYGTIFYDYNNSGYYCDPNSTSNFAGLTVGNQISGSVSGYSTYLPTLYAGGQQLNPQTYFSQSIGLRVAMTAVAGYWSDTLWINGYAGGDVLNMCALHTSRQATPRMWISTQACNGSSYGTIYEFPTYGYNSGNGNATYTAIAYDTNDTGYYSDPNGSSRMASVNANFLQGYNAQSATLYMAGGATSGSFAGYGCYMYSVSNQAAGFAFHKGGYYAVNMALDSDNVIRIGGWSASSNRWQLDMSGNMYSAGNITAYSSDRRLKKNVTVIENPIDMIKQLRGVYFDWEDFVDEIGFSPIDRHDIGVIAQEVQAVIPMAVKPAPFDTGVDGKSESGQNYITVQMEKIVPLLIEVVKKQQEEIDDLKKLVYELINK
jgi:hypothetical protein